MELIFEDYCFEIKYGCINCVMGDGVDLEQLAIECKDNDGVEMVLHPVSNQMFYKTVKKQLNFAFDQSKRRKKEKILDVFRIVGLDESFINRRIETLSNSELYLISLACTFLINPQIIILDNPNIYLDVKHLNSFIKVIRTIKRRYNKTIIIFSNDSDFVHMIGDYLFIIDQFGILKEGNKYEVFSNDKLLDKLHINLPQIIQFEKYVLDKKKINLGYRDNINDLIKDIYYYHNC